MKSPPPPSDETCYIFVIEWTLWPMREENKEMENRLRHYKGCHSIFCLASPTSCQILLLSVGSRTACFIIKHSFVIHFLAGSNYKYPRFILIENNFLLYDQGSAYVCSKTKTSKHVYKIKSLNSFINYGIRQMS